MNGTHRLCPLALVLLLPAMLSVAETVADSGTWMGGFEPLDLPHAATTQPEGEPIDDAIPDETVHSARVSGTRSADAEHVNTDSAADLPSAAEVLAGLEPAQEANALIQIELLGTERSDALRSRAAEIARWWTEGLRDQAVAALEQLGAVGASFAVPIHWKQPIVSTEKRWYTDVRIGGTREDARKVVLDYDPETDNLFAAVEWLDGWSMNVSTDDGVSWQETFFFPVYSQLGMAVAGDYAWVGYSLSSAPEDVRMRRFHVATGNPDGAYAWELVDDVGPQTVRDLEVGANADDFDNRVFIGVITNGDDVRFYWTDLTATTFGEISPPVRNADRNLDFTWNKHATSGYALFLSYMSTGLELIVWRTDVYGNWEQVRSAPHHVSYRRIGISAYKDAVYLAHEHSHPYGVSIRYHVSFNGGDHWNVGVVWEPGPDDFSATSPDVSLRSGVGSALVFSREEGPFDRAYFTTLQGYEHGVWSEPEHYNNHDLWALTRTHIEWLGTDRVMSYGMVYFADGYIPYFDLMTPRAFFDDGFESGDLSAW